MISGLYALRLATIDGVEPFIIRLTANKSVTRKEAAEFLRSRDIPVGA
ncbi:MAG: hypothetical protein WCO52_04860 [bacterium]